MIDLLLKQNFVESKSRLLYMHWKVTFYETKSSMFISISHILHDDNSTLAELIGSLKYFVLNSKYLKK